MIYIFEHFDNTFTTWWSKVFGQTVWANSVYPDQTAPDQGLHCLPFRLQLLDMCTYEGCPSKLCTCFITQDQAVGIIWNLYDLYLYISQISCHNSNKIAFVMQKLWTFNWRYVSVCGAALMSFVTSYDKMWCNLSAIVCFCAVHFTSDCVKIRIHILSEISQIK